MDVRDATEDVDGPKPSRSRPSVGNVSAGNASVTALEAVLIIPLACWLCWQATVVDWTMIGWGALFFVVCIVAVDLIPIPAWEDIELSLSFPIMIGVAMLYSPPVAGMIAIVGSSDIHELRREIPFLRAMWNRSQMALAIIAASLVFHQLASVTSPVVDPRSRRPGGHDRRVRHQRDPGGAARLAPARPHGPAGARKMHGTRPVEFLASYIGLALFGVVIARFFIEEGAWSVVVFLAPARVRPPDVLPEPRDGRPPRGAERAPDGAGRSDWRTSCARRARRSISSES